MSRVGGGHDYLITPVIDAGLIDTFTADPANAAYFVLDETSTLANATLGDLDLGEDIASGYAMANLDFGSITVTPGIRVERTDLTIRGFQLENETDEIGRASCRERVCQYVYVPVVAVTLKKK